MQLHMSQFGKVTGCQRVMKQRKKTSSIRAFFGVNHQVLSLEKSDFVCGSCISSTSSLYLKMPDVDGALVVSASLDAKEFL